MCAVCKQKIHFPLQITSCSASRGCNGSTLKRELKRVSWLSYISIGARVYLSSRSSRSFWWLATWPRAHGYSVYKHDPRIHKVCYETAGKCRISQAMVTCIVSAVENIETLVQNINWKTLWMFEQIILLLSCLETSLPSEENFPLQI